MVVVSLVDISRVVDYVENSSKMTSYVLSGTLKLYSFTRLFYDFVCAGDVGIGTAGVFVNE